MGVPAERGSFVFNLFSFSGNRPIVFRLGWPFERTRTAGFGFKRLGGLCATEHGTDSAPADHGLLFHQWVGGFKIRFIFRPGWPFGTTRTAVKGIIGKLGTVILAWLWVFPIHGQQIVWEKTWGFLGNAEEINKVIPERNSTNFLAIGTSTKWSQAIGNGFFGSLILQKISPYGDTIFLKRLGTIPVIWPVYLGHKFGNVYQAIIQSPINNNNLPVVYPCLAEFTDVGQVLSTQYLTAYPEYRPTTCLKTADGGLILAGYYNGGLTTSTNMMAIKVNFLGEVEWANQYQPPVVTKGIANRIEPMANGNFLLSGTMGRRIYGFEIDSTGVEVRQKTFYETPSNRAFDNGEAIQAWEKGSLSFGYYRNGNGHFLGYLGRHDSAGNKIWGGESIGKIVNKVIVNRENSFLIAQNSTGISLSRISRDSSYIWVLSLGGNDQPYRILNGLTFTQPDTGLAFGFFNQQTGNLNNQFWIAKIAGVGTAYDPTNPDDTVNVSVEERMFRPKDAPVLYPNPATETLHFHKLTGATRVGIYSMQGQKVREYRIEPEQPLDICDLPPGAYLYHLNMGERVFTGKFWKR